MKIQYYIIIGLLLISVIVSGCTLKQTNSSIKYQRRFEKYLPENTNSREPQMIDLSEGPKTRYDAKFGPKDLNFDIKINNPY